MWYIFRRRILFNWHTNTMMKKTLAILATMIFFAGTAFALFNPAARYCQHMGYDYVIKDTTEGQIGYCIMPDSTKCDEWAFFSGLCGQEYSYCVRKGYDVEVREATSCVFAMQCSYCILEDGQAEKMIEVMDKNGEPLLLEEKDFSFQMKEEFIETYCGDGVCDEGEDSDNCYIDCKTDQETTSSAGSGFMIFGLILAILVFIGLGYYLYKTYLE